MYITSVNGGAIVVSAIASMIVGMVWYSQALFGPAWAKLMGASKEQLVDAKKHMGPALVVMFISSLLAAYVIGMFNVRMATPSLNQALGVAFFAWLGFVATTILGEHLFDPVRKKPVGLFFVNAGHQLASMLVMGAIMGSWM